jgi:hypothetical protein
MSDFKILFAIIFIVSYEIFQLPHVIFVFQFLSRKIQNVNHFISQIHVRVAYLFLVKLTSALTCYFLNYGYHLGKLKHFSYSFRAIFINIRNSLRISIRLSSRLFQPNLQRTSFDLMSYVSPAITLALYFEAADFCF